MKKVAFIAALFSSVLFFSQENQSYLQIGYASICCGPPSKDPVIHALKQFEKKAGIKDLEILIQTGLGREGEFNLYVGTDHLTDNQKKELIRSLQSVISEQNGKRQQNSSGIVNFDPGILVHQADLINAKNLTIYKK